MKRFLDSSGRVFYSAPFIVFGLFHFLHFGMMKEIVPEFLSGISGFLVLLTGGVMVLGGILFLIARFVKWAGIIMAIQLLLFAVLVHLLNMLGGDFDSMSQLLKDLALAGGAMILASTDY